MAHACSWLEHRGVLLQRDVRGQGIACLPTQCSSIQESKLSSSCCVQGELVIDRIGLYTWVLHKDKPCCPMCYQSIVPATAIFWRCS